MGKLIVVGNIDVRKKSGKKPVSGIGESHVLKITVK
jgi:hypothetical protein